MPMLGRCSILVAEGGNFNMIYDPHAMRMLVNARLNSRLRDAAVPAVNNDTTQGENDLALV